MITYYEILKDEYNKELNANKESKIRLYSNYQGFNNEIGNSNYKEYSYDELEEYLKKIIDDNITISIKFVNGYLEIAVKDLNEIDYNRFLLTPVGIKDDSKKLHGLIDRVIDYYYKSYNRNQKLRNRKFKSIIGTLLEGENFPFLSDQSDVEELRYYYNLHKKEMINKIYKDNYRNIRGEKIAIDGGIVISILIPTMVFVLKDTSAVVRYSVGFCVGGLLPKVTEAIWKKSIEKKNNRIFDYYYDCCLDNVDNSKDFYNYVVLSLLDEINSSEKLKGEYLGRVYNLLEKYLTYKRLHEEIDKKILQAFYDDFNELRISFRRDLGELQQEEKDDEYLDNIAKQYKINV